MRLSIHPAFVAAALITLLSACGSPTTEADRFVVADLFATPGKALATIELSPTLPVSPTPQATDEAAPDGSATAPLPTVVNFSGPTQPVPTFNPRQPTLPPPTITPTPTNTPGGTNTPGPTSTPRPASPTPTTQTDACVPDNAPFQAVFQDVSAVRDLIGCAGDDLRQEPAAYQPFENGYMILLSDLDAIFVITTEQINTSSATTDDWSRFTDPYDGSNDPIFPEQPPNGLFAPEDGFGLIWLAESDLRDQLGWATAGRSPYITDLLAFENGLMLHGPSNSPVFALQTTAEDDNSGIHLGPLP